MIDIRFVDANNPDTVILKEAASLIANGEIVVCPTDTCYIFAANALDPTAIQKVFALKWRSFNKPIHVAVSAIEETEKYAHVNEAAKVLAREFLPGPLTLVLPRREIVPPLLTAGRDTIGIRVPDNRIVLMLAHMAGCPLTATSANISGEATPYTLQEVVDQLGPLIQQVALGLDQGVLVSKGISTIVDLTIKPPQILRQGRISDQEIQRILSLTQNLDLKL